MRRITLLLISIVALLTASCTHNNGNIGFWFGTWQCEEITIDGVRKADYAKNMFFKFQTNVCDIVVTYAHNDYRQRFAEFKEQGAGTITLDFSYTAEGDWAVDFNPPVESMLKKGLNVLKFNKVNSRKVILTFDNDGQTITYTLKKQ